jgi:predicted RNA-binding Zn ribbon-like protein
MTLPDWSPHEQKPAPEPLLLVQSFVNTRDFDQGTDLLAEAAAANQWLHQAGLLAPEATAGAEDLRTARAARECIRSLIAQNSGGPGLPALADDDLRPLRAVTRASQPRLAIDLAGQVVLESPGQGRVTDGLLGLLLIIRDAQHDGTWPRLKICGNPDCRWAFYDRSHSRRGAWCDMASCGNLIKNRNLRARRGSRTQPAGGAARAARQPATS